ILLVAADEGFRNDLVPALERFWMLGSLPVAVFLNKVDLVADQHLLSLAELEIRLGLSRAGIPGDDVPIVRGSARVLAMNPVENADVLDELMDFFGQRRLEPEYQPLPEYAPQPRLPDEQQARHGKPLVRTLTLG